MTFKVTLSKEVFASLEDLQRRMVLFQHGNDHGISSALRQIHEALLMRADQFGDPLFQLRGMRVEIRVAMVSPIVVYYGIHEDGKTVSIQDFRYSGLGIRLTRKILAELQTQVNAEPANRYAKRFADAVLPVGESVGYYQGLLAGLWLHKQLRATPSPPESEELLASSIDALIQTTIQILRSPQPD